MRGGIQLTIALVLVELQLSSALYRCDRTPEGHVAPKTPADNRFQLRISGSPEKYVPGEGYTISLQGLRNHGQVAQKFTGFMLVVEPQTYMPLRVVSARDVTARPVGTFQLYGDTLTKFSPNCPNMVTHTSSMPKSEIQVRWTAPPPGSGCVIFKVTVIEHRDVWYQDDGPLSKMLCEEEQESHNTQPEVLDYCCACDEAKYEVTFEGLWSRHTHPKDFPSNSWLTRFSDVIGASHSTEYRFWEYGGIASEGLRQVAERGSTRMLESELKAQSQHIRTIIKARGISYPNVTGKTFAVFRVDKLHHLMSLVSMIDPSPDWIVGVSALELCMRNCSWVESRVLNLYPWDAGTDSGLTYISPDQQTVPRDKIRQITSSFPNDPRSPFYDPSGADMKPLARLYLTRQRLYEKTCEEEPTVTNECALTEWSEWEPCSASCGPGITSRQRHYRNKSVARNCPTTQLTDKKKCMDRQCRYSIQPTQEPFNPNCEVKEWGDWSRCIPEDESCTRGTQKRYRQVIPRNVNKRKFCISVTTDETRECRPSMSPSICPKKGRNQVHYKDPQSSTCCAEDDDYGHPDEDSEAEEKDNETIDPNDNTDDNGEGDRNENNIGDGGDDGEGDGEDNGEGDRGVYVDSKGHDDNEDFDPMEEPTGECAMTQWSVWSPCSVDCGVGQTHRFRQLLYPPDRVEEPRAEYLRAPRNDDNDYGTYDENDNGEEDLRNAEEYPEGPCSIYKIHEVIACNGTYPTCQLSSEDAKANEDDGQTTTEEVTTGDEDLEALDQTRDRPEQLQEGTERPVRNCRFSPWSEWSKCDAQCNQQGYKERTRYILVHARNGGKDCVGKTKKRRRCTRKCKFNEDGDDEEERNREHEEERRGSDGCKYSDWNDWTECTATCGHHAMRQRTRLLLAGSPAECTDRIRKRPCNVGPCPH